MPREGARLGAPPDEVVIDFTEPPTSEFRLQVLDGCGNDTLDDAEVRNRTITASLAAGQPGEWTVLSSVISGLDGHQTNDSFSFAVRGPRDCSQDAPADTTGDDGAGDDAPVTPLLIGGVLMLLLIAAAFVARVRS